MVEPSSLRKHGVCLVLPGAGGQLAGARAAGRSFPGASTAWLSQVPGGQARPEGFARSPGGLPGVLASVQETGWSRPTGYWHNERRPTAMTKKERVASEAAAGFHIPNRQPSRLGLHSLASPGGRVLRADQSSRRSH
jgi:hypothetical protein